MPRNMLAEAMVPPAPQVQTLLLPQYAAKPADHGMGEVDSIATVTPSGFGAGYGSFSMPGGGMSLGAAGMAMNGVGPAMHGGSMSHAGGAMSGSTGSQPGSMTAGTVPSLTGMNSGVPGGMPNGSMGVPPAGAAARKPSVDEILASLGMVPASQPAPAVAAPSAQRPLQGAVPAALPKAPAAPPPAPPAVSPAAPPAPLQTKLNIVAALKDELADLNKKVRIKLRPMAWLISRSPLQLALVVCTCHPFPFASYLICVVLMW